MSLNRFFLRAEEKFLHSFLFVAGSFPQWKHSFGFADSSPLPLPLPFLPLLPLPSGDRSMGSELPDAVHVCFARRLLFASLRARSCVVRRRASSPAHRYFCITASLMLSVLSGGLATLVVVERPSTCQDSHLTGKPGASHGSLLRVAQWVPLGMGGTPNRAHGRRIIEFDCTTVVPCPPEGPR